jgi:carboxyl-terminal processing protease
MRSILAALSLCGVCVSLKFNAPFKLTRQKILSTVLVPLSLSFSFNFDLPSANAEVTLSPKYPLFNEVWTLVDNNFVEPVPDWDQVYKDSIVKLDDGANENLLTKKVLKRLGDKYTRLLEKSFYESLWKYDAIGVGLLFQSDNNKPLTVASPPISGSSGEKAGIQKGDLIYSINSISTEGMTAMQVLDMMSNDPSDKVTLEVGKPGESARKSIALTRSTEKAKNPVTYSVETLKDGSKVGYISLGDFNVEAVPGLREALKNVQAKADVNAIVLDIRGNTGGGFQFALNIGGMFMDNKEMATAKGGKDLNANVFRTSYPDGVLTTKPLILLVDGLSASASEVLAGGLHDNCRAVIIGSKTFGKGKIQAVFGLQDGEGLTMTVAQYVTPRGTVIQSKGLQPDIPLDTTNPFIAHLTGALSKPDLNKVDFKKAEEITKACVASQL